MDLPGRGQLCLGLPRTRSFSKPWKVSEAQIEKSICDYLRIKGFFFWKQPNSGFFYGKVVPGTAMMVGKFQKHSSPYTRQGIPDLILVHRGRFIGLEVKTERNGQTESQRDFQRDLQNHGGLYFVVRSVEDVETILKGI